jgi:hypothetical protein
MDKYSKQQQEKSALGELFNYAGAVFEDGINLFLGESPIAEDEESTVAEDEESTVKGFKELEAEIMYSSDEESAMAMRKERDLRRKRLQLQKTAKQDAEMKAKLRKEKRDLRDIDEMKAEEKDILIRVLEEEYAMRHYKEIGEDRERKLKNSLSELVKSNHIVKKNAEQDREPAPTPEDEKEKGSKRNIVVDEANIEKVEVINVEDGNASFDEDDEVAYQIVHEILQLLQYSRKTKNEAQRLMQYKRVAIAHNREVHPDLEAQLIKILSHQKLTASFDRFMVHKVNGDFPVNRQTLQMEKQLRQNIKSLKALASESEGMSPQSRNVISLIDITHSTE